MHSFVANMPGLCQLVLWPLLEAMQEVSWALPPTLCTPMAMSGTHSVYGHSNWGPYILVKEAGSQLIHFVCTQGCRAWHILSLCVSRAVEISFTLCMQGCGAWCPVSLCLVIQGHRTQLDHIIQFHFVYVSRATDMSLVVSFTLSIFKSKATEPRWCIVLLCAHTQDPKACFSYFLILSFCPEPQSLVDSNC